MKCQFLFFLQFCYFLGFFISLIFVQDCCEWDRKMEIERGLEWGYMNFFVFSQYAFFLVYIQYFILGIRNFYVIIVKRVEGRVVYGLKERFKLLVENQVIIVLLVNKIYQRVEEGMLFFSSRQEVIVVEKFIFLGRNQILDFVMFQV